MILFFDQVMELQHVHHTHRHWRLERFARSSIKQHGLTRERQLRFCQKVLHIAFVRTVKYGRCDVNTVFHATEHFLKRLFVGGLDCLLAIGIVFENVRQNFTSGIRLKLFMLARWLRSQSHAPTDSGACLGHLCWRGLRIHSPD